MRDNTWMDDQQCWERLRAEEVGRLGYHLVDELHIVPVNYVVDEDRLVFRTKPGSKLLGVVMNSDVAFEIDGGDSHRPWSVLARGRARVLEGDEARAAEALPLRPWISQDRFTFVVIEVGTLTGRQFELAQDD